MTPKFIANKLLNLPRQQREWLLENVAPQTFRRWCGQSIHLKLNIVEKINKLMVDNTELSGLAKYEFKEFSDSMSVL